MQGNRFAGKVVVVTGAGSGIGAATAKRFAGEGASVAVLDLDPAAAEATAAAIQDAGGRAFPVAVDVARRDSVAAAFRSVAEQGGPVDVLVSNAGISQPAPLEQMTDAQWTRVLDVNLKGAFLCSQIVAPQLRERRAGKIVVVASMAVLGGPIGRANYTASKAGLVGLTRALAMDLAPFGVNVNAVAPGAIQTPLTARTQSAERWEQVRRVTPLGRIGRPDDVASAVLFLASDEASFITAQCLYVCGGRSIQGFLP